MSRVSRRKKKISEGFHIGGKSVRFHWGDYSFVEADVDRVPGGLIDSAVNVDIVQANVLLVLGRILS